MEFSYGEIQAYWFSIRGVIFTFLLGFGAAAFRIMLTKEKHNFLYFCLILILSGVSSYLLSLLLGNIDIIPSLKEITLIIASMLVYDAVRLLRLA